MKRTNATDEAMMGDELRLLSGDLSQGFEDGLSARALLSIIRRHLAMVLVVTLSLSTAGALVGLGLPAWYQADAVLVIHSRPERIADVQELPDPPPDLAVIRSEGDILQSRSVIEPVVRSLKLWQVPEFQKSKFPGGWNWQTVESRLREMWGFASGPEASSREQPLVNTPSHDANTPTQAQIDEAVETYSRYLLVGTGGDSMTIRVSYRARTPERAATIVNAHIDSYRNLDVKAKVIAAQRANSALTAQVAALQKQLQAAESVITSYREEHHLTGAANDNAGVSQQLVMLNNQLIAVRADLAENEARAAQIGAGAGSKDRGDSVPEVVASGTISALRGQEAQLVAREADLSNYHGDEYPELQRVRASLHNLRGQISSEIGRDRAAALEMVERSRARERSIEQSITELTRQVNYTDAGLQQLQENAEAIRSLMRDFEKRVEETAANPAFITPNSTLASRANASATSTLRKAPVFAFAGGFVGLILGSLLALLLELRDKTFRTSGQVERQIGSLTVNATPRAVGRQRKFPADVILNDNRSALAEAFRVSWANIQFAVEGPRAASFGERRRGTVLGITSAASGEGKSTHALALARTAALAGESVVLVDADLRRSGVSRLLNQKISFSLRDFVQNRCTANDVIAIEECSGVHFVPSISAAVAWTSQDLQRFFNFIDYLKGRFAIVIIDLPPLLGLAETIRLAVAADSIALIVRWGRTERQTVQFALDTLHSAGVSTIAVVLNDIDLKAQQRRGHRDRTAVYTDRALYRASPGYRKPDPQAALPVVAAAKPDAHSETSGPELQADDTHHDQPRPVGSDIARLYDRYHGKPV